MQQERATGLEQHRGADAEVGEGAAGSAAAPTPEGAGNMAENHSGESLLCFVI